MSEENAIEAAVRRIVAKNQQQRGVHSSRMSRLLDITLNGNSDDLDRFLAEVVRDLEPSGKGNGEASKAERDVVATGGAVRGVESETGSGQPTEDTGSGSGVGSQTPVG